MKTIAHRDREMPSLDTSPGPRVTTVEFAVREFGRIEGRFPTFDQAFRRAHLLIVPLRGVSGGYSRSFVELRQVEPETRSTDPGRALVTWEVFHDGVTRQIASGQADGRTR